MEVGFSLRLSPAPLYRVSSFFFLRMMKRIKEFGIGGEGEQVKGASVVCVREFRNLRKMYGCK
ncbi:hypothetical protein MA16_Dca001774 [Dendrobium catenatum]|uniref:Uncharacterized protein n=1 Tax=Dendrobium catenatum TaxID=906689 RepID=A0A2I0XDG7_9ASPA|nr:hypothetical protein MA16_Dca001774 [Dendrobium catenatum]